MQQEGDLIVIPPRWWHQVYHLEPSVAVAGQYVNDKCSDRMLAHVHRWCSSEDGGDSGGEGTQVGIDPSRSLEEQVLETLQRALVARHGAEQGRILFRALYDR